MICDLNNSILWCGYKNILKHINNVKSYEGFTLCDNIIYNNYNNEPKYLNRQNCNICLVEKNNCSCKGEYCPASLKIIQKIIGRTTYKYILLKELILADIAKYVIQFMV
jgi:pullulanase/glycogen debranching enzyme